MTENVYERIKRATGSNGQNDSAGADRQKQPPGSINMPALAVVQKVYNTAITVPEIKALSNDRRSRREAHEAQRELGQIALRSAKFGVAMEAVRSVGTYAVASFDRGQEDVMEVFHSKSRYPEMNEMMGQVVAQSLQQMAAGILALAELHIKRQTEEL